MSLQKVTPGAKAPDQFNVIIEIPMNADPVKYEVDKDSGALFVDRFMSTAMHYPCTILPTVRRLLPLTSIAQTSLEARGSISQEGVVGRVVDD